METSTPWGLSFVSSCFENCPTTAAAASGISIHLRISSSRLPALLVPSFSRCYDEPCPETATRFANAREFQQALADCPELKGAAEPLRQKRGIVPYLKEVLKVYNRGSCNAENRGMDSNFARSPMFLLS